MTAQAKVWVIKVGGALLSSSDALHNLFASLQALMKSGEQLVLVHGGGATVEHQLSQSGFTSEKLAGLRVSPQEQMPVIAGALAGTVNKQLVAHAIQANISAVGISLADGQICHCEIEQPELGCVGVPYPQNAVLLQTLLKIGVLPVVSSIGVAQGQLVNVNADDAAAAVAELLDAELIFLSDVPGVLDQNKQLIPQLDHQLANQLIQDKVIQGGMAVKVQAALDTAQRLRRSIAVTSWKQPELLADLIDGKLAGTRVNYSAA